MGCGRCRDKTKPRVSAAAILKAPVMQSDGVIQYPKGHVAPLVDGYTPDDADKSRLIPDADCACSTRMTGIMLQKDGTYQPNYVCMQSGCEHKSKAVTIDICKECPFRQST